MGFMGDNPYRIIIKAPYHISMVDGSVKRRSSHDLLLGSAKVRLDR